MNIRWNKTLCKWVIELIREFECEPLIIHNDSYKKCIVVEDLINRKQMEPIYIDTHREGEKPIVSECYMTALGGRYSITITNTETKDQYIEYYVVPDVLFEVGEPLRPIRPKRIKTVALLWKDWGELKEDEEVLLDADKI